MYVSANRFILKTCGTTTLLHAIEPLIQLVQTFFPSAVVMVCRHSLSLSLSLTPTNWVSQTVSLGHSPVQEIFYSHLNFLKPHLQPHPHYSADEEVLY